MEENQDNNSNNGETWLDEKDKVSTISGLSTPKEIAATRALDRDNDRDPLSLDVVDEQLIVHRFAGSPDPQTVSAAVPEAAGGPVLRVFVPVEQQFTILLNKFNTVKDHVSHALSLSSTIAVLEDIFMYENVLGALFCGCLQVFCESSRDLSVQR